MILLITGNFPIYDNFGIDTGETEFVVSHGVNYYTGVVVILPCEHPATLGAYYDRTFGEWIIPT